MLRVGRHPLPVTMNNGLFLFLEMTPTPSFCTVLTNLVWYRSVTTRNGERLRLSKRNSSRQPPSLLSSITFITLSLPSTIHVLSLMAHTQFLRDYSPIGQPTNIIHAQCLSTDRVLHNLANRVCGNRSYHGRLGPMTGEIYKYTVESHECKVFLERERERGKKKEKKRNVREQEFPRIAWPRDDIKYSSKTNFSPTGNIIRRAVNKTRIVGGAKSIGESAVVTASFVNA